MDFFSKKHLLDTYLFIVACFVLVLSLFLAFVPNTTLNEQKAKQLQKMLSGEPLGFTTNIVSDVRRKIQRDFSWYPIYHQDKIYEGDSIFTGNNSSATITFNDGTKLEIAPTSLVVIRKVKNTSIIDLQKGSITSNIKKGGALSIKMNDSVQQLTGTDTQLVLTKNLSGNSKLTVLKGEAVLDNNISISENKEVTLNKVGAITKTMEYFVNLLEPKINAQFLENSQESILFKWSSIDSNIEYKIVFFEDAKLEKMIKSKEVEDSSLALRHKIFPKNIPIYWIVYAQIDSHLRKPHYLYQSTVGSFVIHENKACIQVYPADNTNIDSTNDVVFEWMEDPSIALLKGQQNYEIIISTSKKVILTFKTNSLKGSIPGFMSLKDGEYFWKVRTLQGESDTRRLVISRQQKFHELNKIQATLERIRSENGSEWKFHWNRIVDGPYTLGILQNPDNMNKVITKKMFAQEENEWVTQLPTKGKLYWFIKTKHFSSDLMEFDNFVVLEPPVLKKNLLKKTFYPGNSIPFSWENVDHANKYILEISNDRSFSQIYKSIESIENFITLQMDIPGVYFARVVAINGDIYSRYSKIHSFDINVLLDRPELKVQRTIVSATRPIEFTWTSVPKAIKYLLEIQQHDFDQDESNDPERFIFNGSETTFSHIIKKEGKYNVKIKALGENGITGLYSNPVQINVKSAIKAPVITNIPSFAYVGDEVEIIWRAPTNGADKEMTHFELRWITNDQQKIDIVPVNQTHFIKKFMLHGKYQLDIRAISLHSEGLWSKSKIISIDDQLPVLSLDHNPQLFYDDSVISINWQQIPQVENYEYVLDDKPLRKISQSFKDFEIGQILPGKHTFKVRLVSRYSAGPLAFSADFNFTVLHRPKAPVNLQAIVIKKHVGYLQWENPNDTEDYEYFIQIALDKNFERILMEYRSLQTMSIPAISLIGVYYVRVSSKKINETVASSFSSGVKFYWGTEHVLLRCLTPDVWDKVKLSQLILDEKKNCMVLKINSKK